MKLIAAYEEFLREALSYTGRPVTKVADGTQYIISTNQISDRSRLHYIPVGADDNSIARFTGCANNPGKGIIDFYRRHDGLTLFHYLVTICSLEQQISREIHTDKMYIPSFFQCYEADGLAVERETGNPWNAIGSLDVLQRHYILEYNDNYALLKSNGEISNYESLYHLLLIITKKFNRSFLDIITTGQGFEQIENYILDEL